MIIKAICESDYKAACAIESTSNPYPWTAANLLSSFVNAKHLGAYQDDEQGDKLVAFVLYQIIAGEAEILHIVCEQTASNQGIASQLLTALIAQLSSQNITKLMLEVREDNAAARHLYQKFGFIVDGVRANYYQTPGSDNKTAAVLMHLPLNTQVEVYG